MFKVVIPARFASTRLPGKPLLPIAGKPMIEHVYRCAQGCGAEEVLVATDDERIRDVVLAFGGEVAMTRADHESGTDRIAEVCRQREWADGDVVVNVQGDEPLMPAAVIQQVAQRLLEDDLADIATVCAPLDSAAELQDPNIVKVVRDAAGYALYFSRASVPFQRGAAATAAAWDISLARRHIGIYGYRVGALLQFSQLEPCSLELQEHLEQLRAQWHGMRIHCADAAELPGPGVDTEADLSRVATLLAQR